MDDFSMHTAILVFATYLTVDVLYTRFYIEVDRRHAFRAAALSSALYALLAYGVITYSHNPLYILPLVLGAFLGTFLTVWWSR